MKFCLPLVCFALILATSSTAEARRITGNEDLGKFGEEAIRSYKGDANWALLLKDGVMQKGARCGDEAEKKGKMWCSQCLLDVVDRTTFRSGTMVSLFQAAAVQCSAAEKQAGRSAWDVQIGMAELILASMEKYDPANSFIHKFKGSSKTEKDQIVLVTLLENTQVGMAKDKMVHMLKKVLHRLDTRRKLSSTNAQETELQLLSFRSRLKKIQSTNWDVFLSNEYAKN